MKHTLLNNLNCKLDSLPVICLSKGPPTRVIDQTSLNLPTPHPPTGVMNQPSKTPTHLPSQPHTTYGKTRMLISIVSCASNAKRDFWEIIHNREFQDFHQISVLGESIPQLLMLNSEMQVLHWYLLWGFLQY